ncbi:MAG: DUF2490 domain-containing protein [Polyangiaceae bacterium]
MSAAVSDHVNQTIAGALLVTALTAFAADASAEEVDGQLWTQVVGQGTIAGPLRWYAEAQLRLNEFDQGTQVQQLILRPAIALSLPEGVTIHAGYAWTPTFNPKFNDEQRPWQQLTHSAPLDSITLVNRLRFEQRVIEGVPDVAFRLRYMARTLWLPRHSVVGAVVWDELFLDLNSPAPSVQGGLAQNRFAVGAHVRTLKQLFLEPTFVVQTLDRGGPAPTRTALTGLLAVFINL